MPDRFTRYIRGSDRPRRRGADGTPLCRECGGVVRAPRRTFCSAACVERLEVRTSPSAARERVFERDRGVCAGCGLDTLDLQRRLRALRRRRFRVEVAEEARLLARGFESAVAIGTRRPVVIIRRTFWHADHIRPVVEGGGGCALDNLRTLCLPCHRGVTAELRGRRVLARRREADLDAVTLFMRMDDPPAPRR